MQKIAPLTHLRIVACIATLLLLNPLQAAPFDEKVDDELSYFLIDRGLLNRIEQVRQSMGDKASDLVVTAMGFLGVPYKAGGTTVDNGGFDCSGFVRSMFKQALGLVLPRSAEQQAAATQLIDQTELRPGDLVFFNTMRRAFSHVGIYVGEGKFIHSPKPGSQVRLENMDMNYWSRRFDGARRVTQLTNIGENNATSMQH